MTTELVAADIGGTHARFSLAEVGEGRVLWLGEALTLRTADYSGLAEAWRAFAEHLRRPLPTSAALAFAYPVENDLPKLTNMIRSRSGSPVVRVRRCASFAASSITPSRP